jgi:[acyl-carrier-protein] S-malonyltransferase
MKLALVFPGQGSQFVGMGKDLAQWSPVARETFQEADDTLSFALTRLIFEGPEADLTLTRNTQPAILAVSVAAFRVMGSQLPVEPAFVAGHSLGEYSALVAAQSLSFKDAIMAVRERGKAMQEAVPAGKGSMAALMGMERDEIIALCEEAAGDGGVVSPANFNSPGQIVIAGTKENVLRAVEIFKERGGKRAVELPVSAPFHCSLMEPAAKRVEEVLADILIDSPKTVLINNAEAKPLSAAEDIRPSLIRQVTSPVLWEDSIRIIADAGVGGFLEIGPGKVLSGLVKRIHREAEVQTFGRPEELDAVAVMMDKGD